VLRRPPRLVPTAGALVVGLVLVLAAVLVPLGLTGPAAGSSPAAAGGVVPVLGTPSYAVDGEGWGTAHPRRIFNGGDPSGLVIRIHWRHWGRARATGVGRTYVFRPGGGYYPGSAKIVLRAKRLGDCGDGVPAYTRLFFREARRPGGPVVGRWRAWSHGSGGICSSPFTRTAATGSPA
jgi:hypothetical protein